VKIPLAIPAISGYFLLFAAFFLAFFFAFFSAFALALASFFSALVTVAGFGVGEVVWAQAGADSTTAIIAAKMMVINFFIRIS
jgi:hypothetical protein